MFSLQFISPLQRSYGVNISVGRFLEAMKYLAPFPPSLGARAIEGAILHRPTDMLLGISGLVAFAILFSFLLWQRFLMQYRGEELSEGVAPRVRMARTRVTNASPTSVGVSARGSGSQSVMDFLPPAVGGVVAKELFYLMRNGFGFLLLVLPPAQILFFSTQFAGRRPVFSGRGFSPENFFPAMMAYTVLMLMGPAYNAFAFEGRGILAYFMAPVKFSEIFVGKNLVTAAVMVLEVALCANVLAWRIGWPSLPVLCATIAGLVFTIAGQLPIANWSSLKFPRKLEFGSMRNQRNSGAAVWMMFGVQVVMGGISALVLSAGRWTGNAWLPTEAFTFLAAAAVAGYFASLEPLAEFAEKKKEPLIETLCR
jgi:hypothetical protein